MKKIKLGLRTWVEDKNGKLILHVPFDIEKTAKKEYNFSFEMLRVGGDLQLSELANHLDEQADLEARFAYLAEVARYNKELMEQKFNTWFLKQYAITRDKLSNSKPTEKAIEAYIANKYPVKYRKLKRGVIDAEFNYRLLLNAIFAAIETKGRMLQSLRNVLQGNTGFGLDVKTDGNSVNNIKT